MSLGGQHACTAWGNALSDVSGSLTLSRARMAVTLGCFAVSPQQGLGPASFPPAAFPRVVARVFSDGSVDTSVGLTGACVQSRGRDLLQRGASQEPAGCNALLASIDVP